MATPARAAVAGLGLVLVATAACEGGSGKIVARTSVTPSARATEPSPKPRARRVEEREPTEPRIARWTMRGPSGRYEKRRIRRAVRDIRALGYWDDLTAHVVRVVIAARPGPRSIPKDGRLAHALMTLHTRGPHPGSWCEVTIFARALSDDIERQAVYYSEGRLSAPPPTLDQFWAVILGHELAHCSPRGQKGEGYSSAWEARILDAFGRARLGSPE